MTPTARTAPTCRYCEGPTRQRHRCGLCRGCPNCGQDIQPFPSTPHPCTPPDTLGVCVQCGADIAPVVVCGACINQWAEYDDAMCIWCGHPCRERQFDDHECLPQPWPTSETAITAP